MRDERSFQSCRGRASHRLSHRRTESSERQFDSTVCGWIDWRRVRSDAPDRRDRDHQRWHRGYEWQCQCGERQQHSAYWLLYDHRRLHLPFRIFRGLPGRHRWKPRPGLRHECQPHADDRAGRVRQPILVDIRCSERVDNHRHGCRPIELHYVVHERGVGLQRLFALANSILSRQRICQYSQRNCSRSRAARGVLRFQPHSSDTWRHRCRMRQLSRWRGRRRQCLRPTFHPGNNLRQSSPNRYSGSHRQHPASADGQRCPDIRLASWQWTL